MRNSNSVLIKPRNSWLIRSATKSLSSNECVHAKRQIIYNRFEGEGIFSNKKAVELSSYTKTIENEENANFLFSFDETPSKLLLFSGKNNETNEKATGFCNDNPIERSEEYRKYVENAKERFFDSMNLKCAKAIDYSNKIRRKKEIFYEKRCRNEDLRAKIEEMKRFIQKKRENIRNFKAKSQNCAFQQRILSYLTGINVYYLCSEENSLLLRLSFENTYFCDLFFNIHSENQLELVNKSCFFEKNSIKCEIYEEIVEKLCLSYKFVDLKDFHELLLTFSYYLQSTRVLIHIISDFYLRNAGFCLYYYSRNEQKLTLKFKNFENNQIFQVLLDPIDWLYEGFTLIDSENVTRFPFKNLFLL